MSFNSTGTTTLSGTVTCNGTSFDVNTLSPDSTTNASIAVEAVGDGLGTLMGGSWTESDTNPKDISYSNTGLSMTGTKTESGSITEDVMTITFSSYASTHVYAVSGTVNLSITFDGTANTQFGTITANLTFSGGGGHLAELEFKLQFPCCPAGAH